MFKRFSALAAMGIFYIACGNSPTNPQIPNKPKSAPVIISFTALPETILSGQDIYVEFTVSYSDIQTLTLRLDFGPLNSDIIVMVSPQGHWGQWAGLEWINSNGINWVRFSARRFPTATTTFTLTASDSIGSVIASRVVIVN